MGDENWRDTGVVVDDLSLGEASRGIENFIQIGQLQLPALNFDHRFFAHAASLLVKDVRRAIGLSIVCLQEHLTAKVAKESAKNAKGVRGLRDCIPGFTLHHC